MTDALPAALQTLLDKGTNEDCFDYFRGMEESRRRELAPACQQWIRGLEEWVTTPSGGTGTNPLIAAASVAVFATATASELKKLSWRAVPWSEDLTFRILEDRKPAWIEKWVETLLDDAHYWNRWPLVRRLVVAGLCRRPAHPHFTLGIISGLTRELRTGDPDTIARVLRESPDLIENDLWPLFELEGGGENSLENFDKYSRFTWQDALLTLASEGRLDRSRLLDASLDALERDFAAYRARWFSRFHEALEPTAEERAKRAPRYLGLLESRIPPVVAWAFKIVKKLATQKVYESDELLAALRPVAGARAKGIVKQTLSLADRVVKKSPDTRPAAATLALLALRHEDVEVQDEALNRLVTLAPTPDDAQRAEGQRLLAVVSPIHTTRLQDWLALDVAPGESHSPAESHSTTEAPRLTVGDLSDFDPELRRLVGLSGDALADGDERDSLAGPSFDGLDFDGTEFPRLRPDDRLGPLDDLDELVTTVAFVLENPAQVDDVERCVDAFSRGVGHDAPDRERRLSPIKKRVVRLLESWPPPFSGQGLEPDFRGLVYTWTHGALPTMQPDESRHAIRQFLSKSFMAVAERIIARSPAPLLSAPSHRGGWIDPEVFARRAAECVASGHEPGPEEVVLALLRLAPGSTRALERLPDSSHEWVLAARRALGDDSVPIGASAHLWVAALRSRAPWADHEDLERRHPRLGADGGQAAALEPEDVLSVLALPYLKRQKVDSTKLDPWLPTVHLATIPAYLGHPGETIPWLRTVWPVAGESFCAIGAREIGQNIDWWSASWHHREYLVPLLDPDVPLRPMARLLLALGLGAKEPGEHGLAIDIAIAAIEDGRFDPVAFGEVLHDVLIAPGAKAKRWAKTLAEVARPSELHRELVRKSLEVALADTRERFPRDLSALLELFLELTIATGAAVRSAACRELLGSFTGKSRSAKAAQALLDRGIDEGTRPRVQAEARRLALVARRHRLERWSAYRSTAVESGIA